MTYRGVICPVCGSNLVNELEDGRFKCASCGTIIENASAHSDMNAIVSYLDGSQFDTAENYCRDALARDEKNPVLNWLLFLAKNKIHFVDDPATRERKPVFYSERVFKRDCVFDDENYILSLQGKYKSKYQRFGELIESIRMELCEKMSRDDDIDIFISFKATEEVTDSEGKKRVVETFDQKKGREIYDYFTDKGYKVFFSPVSIGKGKVFGEKYEPKIFAALASCRAMILIGTKKSYITDGWVRDEWTRYLYFMESAVARKNSRLKKAPDTLYYVYDKQPPVDLPSQIAEIQGTDCSEVYYLEELYKSIKARIGGAGGGIERIEFGTSERVKKEKVEIDGIKTIALGSGVVRKKQSVIAGNLQVKEFGENKIDLVDADQLKIIDGAFAALEVGNFALANHEFDSILENGDNATALYGKILLTIKAKNEEEFVKNAEQFPKSELSLYRRLMECASADEAERATNLFVEACKQCCADIETREAVTFFEAVVGYNVAQRDEAIKILKTAIPKLIKSHDPHLEEVIDAYLGTIEPAKVDKYIKECIRIVKAAIKESSFSIAETYNEKVFKLHENNHDAMICRLYIQTQSRNEDELKNRIDRIDVKDVEYVVENSSAANANEDLELFCAAYIDKIQNDDIVANPTCALQTLLKYDFTARDEILNSFSETIIEKSEDYGEKEFEKAVLYVLQCFDSNAVDEYIDYAIKAADVAKSNGWFDLAEKYYRLVTDLDNANLKALYELIFVALRESGSDVREHAAAFADTEGTAIKNLEAFLKFSLKADSDTEDDYRFDLVITQFTTDILDAFSDEVISAEVADKAYLNIIRYVPESNDSLMRDRLSVIAEAMLVKRQFLLADKYYSQILVADKNDFDALWGCVLCEAECENNAELERSDFNFAETKNYFSAYRIATKQEQAELNDVYKNWSKNQGITPLIKAILTKTNSACERDIIKSPIKLSSIPEYAKLIAKCNNSVKKRYEIIVLLQDAYCKLEKEIAKKQSELNSISANTRSKNV